MKIFHELFQSIPNKIKAIYLVWFLIHFILFLSNVYQYDRDDKIPFYPFIHNENGFAIDLFSFKSYDHTEFLVYILSPIFIYIIIYLWKKKVKLQTKIYNYIKNYKDHKEIWLILIIVLMIIKGIFFPIKLELSDETILIPSNSIYKSVLERDTRFQILLTTIQQHKAYNFQQLIASESLKMQGRILFITLFSALITLLFSKQFKQPFTIAIVLFLVGVFWYSINVNQIVIENRGYKPSIMVSNTELKLLNISQEDNRMYYLDFAKLNKEINKVPCFPIIKKIERFLSPDIGDTVFNIIPLLFLALLFGQIKKES